MDITTTPAALDESSYDYDGSGNQSRSVQQVGRANGSSTELARESESRSFYGADERLRAFQEYSISYAGGMGTTTGTWEEYRYDPLGRRVMVISCGVSDGSCEPSVTRFVWSGDQLLWERKSAEGLGTYVSESSGLVSYTHAGGIDRPLAIWKAEVGTIVTHQNWRGQFARGTFGVDQQGPAKIPGQSSDCPSYPPSNGCVPVPWPGWNTTAWHEGIGSPNTTGYEHYWMGSLATGMRDASGQMYMRNRYYDPQTGQFTQPDPIGLAGGLNSYGFAAGDPVTYSDPYGLNCWRIDRATGRRYEVQCPKLESGAIESPAFYADPVALGTGIGAGRVAGARGLAAAGVGLKSGRVMWQATRMLRSSGMAELRSAAEAGVSASVRIGGRTVTYGPAPFSGLTNFADDSFHLGREAFASQAELTKTVLHELYRLSFQAGGEASGMSVSQATNAAANFAEKAYSVGRSLRLW